MRFDLGPIIVSALPLLVALPPLSAAVPLPCQEVINMCREAQFLGVKVQNCNQVQKMDRENLCQKQNQSI